MPRLQSAILAAGFLLSVVLIVVGIQSPTTSDETDLRLRGTAHQIYADLADIQPEFDSLMEKADHATTTLLRKSVQLQSATNWLSWVGIGITAIITLLAAFAGVNPQAVPKAHGRRTIIVITIAVVSGLGSIVQTVNDRLQKIAAEDHKAALVLYDKANSARTAFIDAGHDRKVAEAAKDDLFHAIAEAGL